MNEETVKEIPWSFWLIGAVGLIFNLMGCMNYIAQINPDSVAEMPTIYQAIVEARPAWGTAAFAIAVFGGAVGCVLLLLKKSAAMHVLVVALIATLATQVPFVGMAEFPRSAWIGWASQLGVAAFLVWYAKSAAAKGWIA